MEHKSHIKRTIKHTLSAAVLLFTASAYAGAGDIGFVHTLYTDNNAAWQPGANFSNPYQTNELDLLQLSASINIAPAQLTAENRLGADYFSAANTSAQAANDSSNITPVPLPATILLFGGALTGLIGISRRRHWLTVVRPAQDVNIMGLSFPNLNYQQTLKLFQEWIFAKESHQVVIANVHTLVTCLNDKELRSISHKSLNTMDGLPLVWYAKLVHNAGNASRVCGPDLMLKCLDHGRNMGWKHFFLGGTETVLNDLVSASQKRFPGVEIVGWHSPAFRPLSNVEDAELVNMINAAKPDFLWVGLGAPKQEKWIAAHLDKIHVPVQLGVGAAFNFHSGHVRRAPNWMQKFGLEWLYRMSKETRLIKRYLETNPVFLMHLIKDITLVRVLNRKIS